jgi:hypothetical protein
MNRDQTDPEQAERVRQIQEEIRRKIAARRGQTPPSIPAPPELPPFNPMRPVFGEEIVPPRQAPPAPPPIPVERETVPAEDTAAMERQRRLAEQLAELENRRRETRRAAQAFAETGESPVSSRPAAGGQAEPRSVSEELRDPRALRRAMVLREVLGTPVALR